MPPPGLSQADPVPRDWANMDLPGSWVDELDLLRPSDLWRLLTRIFGAGRPVLLPPDMPGRSDIPDYLLREFHRLPNGNYSKGVAEGYRRGFDISMLGTMATARRRIAQELAGAGSALDAGCGGGELAGAMTEAGIGDVWALDPCPYLLKEGARRFPEVRFIQGVAEKTPFPDGRFDGVGASFLFHELPSEIADLALVELGRIMKPGARLVIAEPSPVQMREKSLLRLLKLWGWRGPYFKLLAGVVTEPYVREWHRTDPGPWLAQGGFRLLKDEIGMPMRVLSAQKAG